MHAHALAITFSVACLMLAACSSTPYREPPEWASYSNRLHGTNTESAIKTRLAAQHRKWRGTPYKYGGLSKQGTDCSGFVYLTYRNQFDITVPRTTEQLASSGMPVSQGHLKPGDLVFFKTGFYKLHVGIYMGKRKFLHVSTSRGVMISSMDNIYWHDRYWISRRI